MKVRVKWTKTGVLKFIGHLDVQRYFQKALMRAELPVSFSAAFAYLYYVVFSICYCR